MTELEKKQLVYASPAALAFLGDAVYELEVRSAMLELDAVHGDALHKKAVPFVCAVGQAKAMRALYDSLTEEEQTVVRRARNKKVSSQPRHADPVDYKWATAFEALLGYWKTLGEEEKIRAFSQEAMAVVRKAQRPEDRAMEGEDAAVRSETMMAGNGESTEELEQK